MKFWSLTRSRSEGEVSTDTSKRPTRVLQFSLTKRSDEGEQGEPPNRPTCSTRSNSRPLTSRSLPSSPSPVHQDPPPPQERPPPPPLEPRRDRSFSSSSFSTSSAPRTRSPRSSFSSLLRGSASLFRSRSNSTATTFVSAVSSPQSSPKPDEQGEGAGGRGGTESSSTVRRVERSEEGQQLNEAEYGEHDEEILDDEDPRRCYQGGGICSPCRNWPCRDQTLETAECDEYVRMVQFENGW
ncbi:hypothetical protein JCM5350_005077 [Sporobolomyces pararoseus]